MYYNVNLMSKGKGMKDAVSVPATINENEPLGHDAMNAKPVIWAMGSNKRRQSQLAERQQCNPKQEGPVDAAALCNALHNALQALTQ